MYGRHYTCRSLLNLFGYFYASINESRTPEQWIGGPFRWLCYYMPAERVCKCVELSDIFQEQCKVITEFMKSKEITLYSIFEQLFSVLTMWKCWKVNYHIFSARDNPHSLWHQAWK